MGKNSNKMGLHIGNRNTHEKIQWSKNFQLKLEHFKNDETSGRGKIAISILPEYSIGLLGKQLTKYEITNLSIKSLFRPTDAKIDGGIWPESKIHEALLFYQGIFDLSEEIARKAQTELEQKLFRKTFSCKRRGKSERRKFSKNNAQKQITQLMTPFIKNFFEEQLQYERTVGTPDEFEKNYLEYKTRFDKLRKEISA